MPLNGKTPDPDPDSNKSQGEASKNPLQERPVPDYLVDYLTDPTRERYEVLVGKVHRHVHLVASRILNDDLLAAEATQEVLLFLKKPRWKPEEVQKGLGLITRVTVSIARTLRRSLWRERRRKRTLDGLPEPPATKDLPPDIASIVRAAIRELEDAHHTPLGQEQRVPDGAHAAGHALAGSCIV